MTLSVPYLYEHHHVSRHHNRHLITSTVSLPAFLLIPWNLFLPLFRSSPPGQRLKIVGLSRSSVYCAVCSSRNLKHPAHGLPTTSSFFPPSSAHRSITSASATHQNIRYEIVSHGPIDPSGTFPSSPLPVPFVLANRWLTSLSQKSHTPPRLNPFEPIPALRKIVPISTFRSVRIPLRCDDSTQTVPVR